MIIAFAVILVLAAFFYTLFVRQQDVPDPIPVSPIQHLEDRKHAIYDNLRDLQFEYRLGKLTDDDYKQTKQALQKELAVVLSETEQTLKTLGMTSARKAAAQPSRDKQSRDREGAITTCPHCGAKFKEALKFCGECGKAIA
jgi:NADH pyrophosphatase NudC (nudix superfamily)